MKQVYDEMFARQLCTIEAKGFSADSDLLGDGPPARCYAIYTLCDYENFQGSGRFDLLLGQLHEAFGESQVVYSLRPSCNRNLFGALHLTFMQLIGFNVYGSIPIPADYAEVVEAILLRNLPQFEVLFTRVVVTQASVLLAGHPTVGLNNIRDEVRRALARIGYPLYEPYKNDIAHMTLVRFAKPPRDEQKELLLRIARSFSGSRVLAKLAVRQVSISAATWKMQRGELEEEDVRTLDLMT